MSAVLFVNGGTPMKIGPPNFWGSKRPFFGVKTQTLSSTACKWGRILE